MRRLMDEAHLSGLLLEGEELLNSTLHITLDRNQLDWVVDWTHDRATFARS